MAWATRMGVDLDGCYFYSMHLHHGAIRRHHGTQDISSATWLLWTADEARPPRIISYVLASGFDYR